MKIIHIADIHWRGLNRHDEYRDVFERFFIEAKKRAPDVIYIGGDIFHTKTQNITPEVIECLNWWFNSLADIAPLVVILGNHDGNLVNRSRQDAITPIISILQHPRISLYKRSGTYPSHIAGFNWCVFSCFDERGWDRVKPISNEVNIALFHGSVTGAVTSMNYRLDGDVDVDFFRDFDFALLGDIHGVQFLDDRKCVDGKRRPWIAYCGSTIQQNYGETTEHGFLFWDIRSRDDFDVEFVQIPNPRQFVTLKWRDDFPLLIEEAKQYLPGARIRVVFDSFVVQHEWRQISSELRRLGASEVVSKIERRENDEQHMQRVIHDVVHDLRKPETLTRLMREFYADISEEEQRDIEECVAKYAKIVNVGDVSRNIQWSLDKLVFDNTFAYGTGNVIDFSSLSGITGIFAGNAAGKSSIIGTIMYVLFNGTDRGPLKNLHVINIRKDKCQATAHVSIGGVRHIITRTTQRRVNSKGHEHAVTSLNFEIADTQEVLDGEQRSVTEKLIRKKIGTADDFMLTSLAVQGGLKAFISEGAAQRKAILARFLDLLIFDQINEAVKKDAAAIRERVRDMPERDWDGCRDELMREKTLLKEKIAKYEQMIDDIRCELRRLHQQRASLIDEHDDVVDINALQEKMNALEGDVRIAHDKYDALRRSYDVVEHGIMLIERVKSTFPIDDALERERKRDELCKLIDDIERRLSDALRTLQAKRKSVLKLADVPCGDQFPTCKYIRDSHRDKRELPAFEEAVTALRDDLRAKKGVLNALLDDELLHKLRRYRRIVGREQEYMLRLSRMRHDMVTCEHDLTRVKRELEHVKREYDDARIKLRKDVAKERKRIDEKIFGLEKQLSDIDLARVTAATNLGRIEEKLEQLACEHAEYIKLSRQWRVYERVITATSKQGIPSQIMRRLIPMINEEIARILHGVVGFTVTLELPDDSNSVDIYIDYGDSKRLIELGSGMEKMIASIAIRVALVNVTSVPKSTMLFIDEGFSELDETNIDACGNLLRSLTRWFRNIIIITHIDALKDVVDNVIDIARRGPDAYVNCG